MQSCIFSIITPVSHDPVCLCLIEMNYLYILFQINAVLNFYLSNNPDKKVSTKY